MARPRVAMTSRDRDVAIALFGKFLARLGVDTAEIPDMRDTPRRYVQAMTELLRTHDQTDLPFNFTTFPADGLDQLVIVKKISFASMCAHHLLPFYGEVHVGYLPDKHIVGLSKIPRLVEWVAARPQTQEHMTQAIAQELNIRLKAKAVLVVARGVHTCMRIRGVKCHSGEMLTSALVGKEAYALKNEFLHLISLPS